MTNPSAKFTVTPEWCTRARESIENGALEQLERNQRDLDMKREYWRGYLAAIGELEVHIRRAREDAAGGDGDA